jgi:hypothetical protein
MSPRYFVLSKRLSFAHRRKTLQPAPPMSRVGIERLEIFKNGAFVYSAPKAVHYSQCGLDGRVREVMGKRRPRLTRCALNIGASLAFHDFNRITITGQFDEAHLH